jgi:hypothetical protein
VKTRGQKNCPLEIHPVPEGTPLTFDLIAALPHLEQQRAPVEHLRDSPRAGDRSPNQWIVNGQSYCV